MLRLQGCVERRRERGRDEGKRARRVHAAAQTLRMLCATHNAPPQTAHTQTLLFLQHNLTLGLAQAITM